MTTAGALSVSTGSTSRYMQEGTGSADRPNKYSFDASSSNSIYGSSNTVQPQSIKVFYYIVVANSTKTNIEVDIDEIVTDLNGKADKSSFQVVSALPANPDSNVFYFIPE